MEFAVAVHQFRELAQALLAIPGQHHPDVLRRWTHAAVIEVDDVEHLIATHHVARVAIAVHADVGVWRGGVHVFDALEQVAGDGLISRQQAARDAVVFQQIRQRIVAEILHAQSFAVLEGLGCTHGMDTAEQLAQAIQLIQVARLRRPPATARKQGETEAGMFVQGFAVVHHRRHHGNIHRCQFEGKAVFFEDGFVGPAVWSIELGDQRLAVFDADLIDAVLITVQRQNAGVAEKTNAFDSVEYQIGRECCKRVGHAYSCAQQAAASGQSW